MILTYLLSTAMLLPFPSDTPPARRIPAPPPTELRSVDDVVLTARLADGSRAPANITLPAIANRRELFALRDSEFPDTVRNGTPRVMPVAWVYIDEDGVTHFPQLVVSSGTQPFDSLAITMVRHARFEPAMVENKPTPVWVLLPVQLTRATAMSPRPDGDGPRYTPYTVAPKLQNRDKVRESLVRNYPPELRAQGKGGRTDLWVYLNAEGRVERTQIKKSSGSDVLDEAAVRVALDMVFAPAENRGVPVPVWIQLPIVFMSR